MKPEITAAGPQKPHKKTTVSTHQDPEQEIFPLGFGPSVLTIAGFDPTGGAGVLADAKTFAAHGCHAAACVTAITVQSFSGVRSVEFVSAQVAHQTVNLLLAAGHISAVKIGMLGAVAMVGEVAKSLAFLQKNSAEVVNPPSQGITIYKDARTNAGDSPWVVLDTVLRSGSGHPLIESEGVSRLKAELLPLADFVTPNSEELALLVGRDAESLRTREAIAAAAWELQAMGGKLANGRPRLNVAVTGGHLEKPDDFLLTAGGEEHWMEGEWVGERSNWHGTGCAYSSAIAANLALGLGALEAALAAKEYVAGAIRYGRKHPNASGELNHYWRAI